MDVTIAEMRRRVAAALKSTLFQEAINETAVELAQVNKDNLLEGYNALGVKIGTYAAYSNKYYAKKKNQRNPDPGYGNPDLYNKGSFYEKIKVHAEKTKIVWENNDSKAKDLLAKYGSVLGVYENDYLQAWRNRYLWPVICRKFKEQTGIK